VIEPSAVSTGSSKCSATTFGEWSTTRSRAGSVEMSVECAAAAGASASSAASAAAVANHPFARRTSRILPSFYARRKTGDASRVA
jgi:hypothetical protein